MDDFMWFIIIIFLIYTILPTLLIRLFGFGVYKKGKNASASGIALTFDDGPDPEYTPQLLDLLKRYDVKATFFVLGSKAEKHPELITRIHREGHLLGIHNYVHWANALMTPKKVRKQIEQSVQAIENIIGEKPVHYRPPWGVINLFDLLLLKRFRMILWSLMVRDWSSTGGKERIKRELLSKLNSNDVIVLHDSGQTFGADADAPDYMLEALQEFLEVCKLRGCVFLRIDEKMRLDEEADKEPVVLSKRILVYVWLKWEHLFHFFFKVKPVSPHNRMFYIRQCKYYGKTIQLQEGDELRSGDVVVELHFNNEQLFEMASKSGSVVHLAVHMIREARRCFPNISEWLSERNDVKALYGVTMIHQGTGKLGFTVEDLPKGAFARLSKLYLRLLLYMMHPEGKKRLKAPGNLASPKIIAISAKEFLRRYPVRPDVQLEVDSKGWSAAKVEEVL